MSNLTIGQFLQEKRKEKNISWRHASDKTKIHQRLLEHLEKNNFSKLPNLIYLKGFITPLSKVLEFDKDFALALLETDYEDYLRQKLPESQTNQLKKISSGDFNELLSVFSYLFNWKHILWISSAGLLIFVIGFVGTEFSSFNGSIAPKKFRIVLPKKLFASHKPAPIAPQAPIPVEVQPMKKLTIKASQDESWISYQVDKQPERKLTLLKDKELFIQGHTIKLLIGRPEAVTIDLNGQDMDLNSFISKNGTALVNLQTKEIKAQPYVVKND